MPRNMLFLMTDQHRIDTLGCYGGLGNTPNINSIAAGGTLFSDAFTPTAICTPARGSLLTGQAPFRHKLLANEERNVGYIEDLDEDVFTFPAALSEAGYALGLVGKWHAGVRRTAADFGFEAVNYAGWHNPVDHPDYLAYLDEHNYPPYRITDQIRGTAPNGNPGNLLAARLAQPLEATFEHYLATRAIEMMRRFAADDAGRPFFLATHFFGPHLPYIVPSEFYDRYDPDSIDLPASVAETFKNKPPVQHNYCGLWAFDTMSAHQSRKLIAIYRAYVELIDYEIGRLLAELDALGLAEDTAVFFTADHGEFTGSHRLHDKGPAMYDDIYRIPALVSVPGCPSGQIRAEFVSLTDMTATILELADLDPAPALDSRSLMPLVRGEQPQWDQAMLSEFHGHQFPYPQRMLRTRTHKLVVNPESCNELYDLLNDPDELTNCYHDPRYAQVRQELMSELFVRLRDRGDKFYHWMTAMYPIGRLDYDPSLGAFEADDGSVYAH